MLYILLTVLLEYRTDCSIRVFRSFLQIQVAENWCWLITVAL